MFDTQAKKVLTEVAMLKEGTEANSYYFDMLNVEELRSMGLTGEGFTCAVIDTGCDINHPLLKDKIIGGRNFTIEGDGENDYTDLNGHGTHVAGLIAADPCGAFKGGVAPKAKLLICKVLTKTGNGGIGAIINAIDYAIQQKVDVINMSLGTTSNLGRLYDVVKKAYDAGIVICCASGNMANNDKGSIDEFCYPGAYQEVIEVGAINKNKEPSYFSNSNNMIDCVCYGEEILSTYINNRYATLDGTSQATPLVAGCVLLLKQWFYQEFERLSSKDEIYAILIKCSKNMKGYSKKQVGFGYIDLKELHD